MKNRDESDDIINVIIGGNLATKRKQLGLSLEQVSKLAGVSTEKLSEFESAKRRPEARMLFALAKILDTQPQKFFAIPDDFDAADRARLEHMGDRSRRPSVSDGVSIIRAFARIKNRERRHIVLDIAKVIGELDSRN